AGRTPADLLAELRAVGPKALHTRHTLPAVVRGIEMDYGPPAGKRPMSFLLDEVYTRDLWMHRDDICRATGKPFKQTAAHDGRIVAL
ncbi:MAG: maleylpyruvate isomerase family mycothiol-dependent enzyme, partial [Gammaproteobacteria bacterium]|nr:maleylpyruvate isomerase family mycothiol-dependent enzyme [Gammaproteobacteria bacterium]